MPPLAAYGVRSEVVLLQLTDYLAVSMELGCFIAGVMVSAQGHGITDAVDTLITPVKDVLACIFFASIGKTTFLCIIYVVLYE